MKKSMILLRHGPTTENGAGIFMGRMDSPCLAINAKQAQKIATELNAPAQTRIYSSPLRRCTSTAKAIFGEVSLELDERLIERDLGSWSGCSKDAVRKAFPDAFLASGHLDPSFTPPVGEPLMDFTLRVANFLCSLQPVFQPESEIVVVSHNGVIRLIRYLLEGLPLEAFFSESEPHLVPRRCNFAVVGSSEFKKRVDAAARGT